MIFKLTLIVHEIDIVPYVIHRMFSVEDTRAILKFHSPQTPYNLRPRNSCVCVPDHVLLAMYSCKVVLQSCIVGGSHQSGYHGGFQHPMMAYQIDSDSSDVSIRNRYFRESFGHFSEHLIE